MLRRAFLSLLAALPSIPTSTDRPESSVAEPAIEDEGDMWFWYYVHAAITRPRVMSTEQSRKHAVSEMNLDSLSDGDARRILKRADDGDYAIGDMPDKWRSAFEDIDNSVSVVE